MSEWIKCSNRLPEIINETLLITDSYEVIPGFYSSMHEWCGLDGIVTELDISHWMPLPEAPHD